MWAENAAKAIVIQCFFDMLVELNRECETGWKPESKKIGNFFLPLLCHPLHRQQGVPTRDTNHADGRLLCDTVANPMQQAKLPAVDLSAVE